MVNASGFVDDDVMAAIERMTHGWCRFLDLWCAQFTRKMAAIVSWADLERNELARYVRCNGNELPSFWLYPRAA
jgi:ethanolamine utilization protein EutP (predicted NTPase)